MNRPVASPIALSEDAAGANQYRGAGEQVPTQQLPPRARISSTAAEKAASRLSVRDWEVLRLVGRFRVMTGAQIRDLFWPEGTPETRGRIARRALARLVDDDVLAPLDRRVGGVRAGSAGLTFALGLLGARLLAPGYRRTRRPYAPGERTLNHTLAVAQLYVDLILASRWGLGEVLAFDPEPICWSTYPGGIASTHVLKPDASVRLGMGDYEDSWFIELDRGTVSLATIERQARQYAACWRTGTVQSARGVFPRVAWIVPDARRAGAVRDVLARLPKETHRLFVVVAKDEAVAQLAGEVPA